MQNLEQRAAQRRAKIVVQKVALHAEAHHSFHPSFDAKNAWELLAKLSKEAWIEKTGHTPSLSVDKSVYKFIKLSERS